MACGRGCPARDAADGQCPTFEAAADPADAALDAVLRALVVAERVVLLAVRVRLPAVEVVRFAALRVERVRVRALSRVSSATSATSRWAVRAVVRTAGTVSSTTLRTVVTTALPREIVTLLCAMRSWVARWWRIRSTRVRPRSASSP